MNETLIRAKLTDVLQSIQASSGQDCPAILGSTKPVEELPKFDSKIWPIAIGMLAMGLGITIENDVNIFRKGKECVALTIDETVALVLALVEAQTGDDMQVANKK
ncbi:hypothetical protein [Herminiimonas aquatilis]|uniref:Uncharacterized protein n=1 Tax=Herminiimonas aquatilis TaxID=345342 RepID=A0ABW2J7F7_9BURK